MENSACKGHFPLGGIFRTEGHFLLFKDQLGDSVCQKTKEIIVPRGKFLLVENGLNGKRPLHCDALMF